MRFLRRSIPLILISALPGLAQDKTKTDVLKDGLEGQVRSVSTHVETTQVKWQQPSGPTLVSPILCRECEYDADGNRTKSGTSTPNGEFLGETIKITRDRQGNVVQRTRIDERAGTIFEDQQIGPFGPVERTFGMLGKLRRQSITYDALGHEAERLTYDSEGNLVGHNLTRTNADGQWIERAAWGEAGQLEYRETYDPATDFQHFESYDDSGSVRLTFAFSHNRMLSFWAASDAPNQFGDSLTSNKGNGDVDAFKCHPGGACDVFNVHTVYADAANHYPSSVEWRDASGTLLYAADYEYQFDAQNNWTKRVVYVQSPQIPARTLLETDDRSISYWTAGREGNELPATRN